MIESVDGFVLGKKRRASRGVTLNARSDLRAIDLGPAARASHL